MPQVVLIVHSDVVLDAAVPPKQWRLSDRGRELCGPLAEALSMHPIDLIVSSEELKAVETAELLAARLGVPHVTAPDLDEHRRPFVPAGFEATMERVFTEPSQRVLGEESADEALLRFGRAIDSVLADHPGRRLAVVAHGTVIALYAAPYFHVGAAALWQRLAHPSFVLLDTETHAGLRIVDDVEE